MLQFNKAHESPSAPVSIPCLSPGPHSRGQLNTQAKRLKSKVLAFTQCFYFAVIRATATTIVAAGEEIQVQIRQTIKQQKIGLNKIWWL